MSEKYKGKRFAQLTAQQRGHITRLSKELKAVIQAPANFIVRQVKNPSTQKELKAQGFRVVNGRAVIRVDFDGKVKIETTKNKDGSKSVHVRISNKFEEKITYKLRIQDLIASGKVPAWIYSIESKFTARDSWAISIAGKPIGDFFQSIESLLDYFESYLENQLGDEDAAKCVLMRIKSKTPNLTDKERRPRKAEIKDANTAAKKTHKFRR